MSTEVQEPDPATLTAVQHAIVGETLYVSNYRSFAIVRFVGLTEFSKGIWVGLEVPTAIGKNNGSVKGKQYFPCKPQHGIFVRTTACLRRIKSESVDGDDNTVTNTATWEPTPVPPTIKSNVSSDNVNVNADSDPGPMPPAPPDNQTDVVSSITTAADEEEETAPTPAVGVGFQVHGSLTASADEDLSDSSDDEEGESSASAGYPRPLSPPLNLGQFAGGNDDDSEGELEVCIPITGISTTTTTSTTATSTTISASTTGNPQLTAMEAYLATQAERDAKKPSGGLSLISAMESSVNEIIDSEPVYQDPGHVSGSGKTAPATSAAVDAFGASQTTSSINVEVATVAEPTETDIFGIAYKPFKKTTRDGSNPSGKSKKQFDDEEEFEKDLQNSVITKEVAASSSTSSIATDTVNGTQEEDEFDFEVDCPVLDSSELRRTLQAAADKAGAELEASALSKGEGISDSTGESSADTATTGDSPINSGEEGGVSRGKDDNGAGSPSQNYDAYGNAKDALRAIVDIYGCGLGDQEIVIMNSLGAEAAATATSAHHHHPPAALGGSVVPGTGTVAKGKVAKRTSGSNKVKNKIEREKIIEEDEEDYETREREQEVAQREIELRQREETAKLESEWQGLPSSPTKPGQRKSIGSMGGKMSPNKQSPSPRGRNSPLGNTSPGIYTPDGGSMGAGEDSIAASEAYDSLLTFFKQQNLTPYYSEIVTSVEPAKGSWLMGGNVKVTFDGAEDELKFCFSVALVNYDPVKHREHFSALKTIHKFFVPSNTHTTPGRPPTPTSRPGRQRDVGMVGSHWGAIGFQGLDPCTDINRSMRMLSVMQVLNLIQIYPQFARCVHKLSQMVINDAHGKMVTDLTWPFFCVSIGFTKHALQTLRANVLNKRCNKFKSIMTALHEYYRACVYVFARDMIEKSSVHHAHHLSTLRSTVDNSPMTVLKAYKTFIKKKCASHPGMTPHEALCSIFDGHPCGPNTGDAVLSATTASENALEIEDLEFAGLDDIKDNLDNRSPSPEKMSGGFFAVGRKKGYEASL